MTNYEMPQDVNTYGTEPGLPQETQKVEVSAGDVDLSGLVVEEDAQTTGPVVIDAKRFNALTPAESFALAGKLVEDRAREANARAVIEEDEENAAALAENQEYAEAIKADIEREKAMLAEAREQVIAKYGANEEEWPADIKENMGKVNAEHDKHRMGWALAGVAVGVGALGVSNSAEAGGLGDALPIIIQRGITGAQIEAYSATARIAQERSYVQEKEALEATLQYEKQMVDAELRAQEARLNAEWGSQVRLGKATEEEYNAAFDIFAANAQAQRERFMANAQQRRSELDIRYKRAAADVEYNRQSQHDYATGSAINQGAYQIQNKFYERWR